MSAELFFDYASPWAFLASELVPRLLPGVNLTYAPIYLRGLEAFKTGFPYSSAKAAYIVQDLGRSAAHYGIALRPPSVFPINGLQAVRGATWALGAGVFPAYHAAMFRAAWQEDRNVSDRATVVAIAAEIGLDAHALGAALDDAAIKDALKASTERAVKAGVFGVPTFRVGDELFWGADRMDFVARALARRAP